MEVDLDVPLWGDTRPRVVRSVAPAPLMKEGDLIILYCGRDNIVSLRLKAGAIFRNKYGEFKHSDMIGRPLGSCVMFSGPPSYLICPPEKSYSQSTIDSFIYV